MSPAPRSQPVADAVEKVAAHRLVALLNEWNDGDAAALFDDNVDLDDALVRRRAEAGRLIAAHGPLHIVELRPAAATRGDIVVQGTGATFTIGLELSPLPGAPVQFYEIDC
mgnify:CR=1 FL=1